MTSPRTTWALAMLLALSGGGIARAECTESALMAGVQVRECTEPGRRWAELSADLAAVDVGVRVSRPGERGVALDGWVASVPGVVAAIQGGGFAFPSYAPHGLTIGDGVPWGDGRDDPWLGVLALDSREVGLVAPPTQVVPPEDWMANAVSGPTLLQDGVVLEPCAGDGCERRPRTGVGLSADGRFLVAVVAAGYRADAPGPTDPELAELLLAAGAADAIRTGDGATSSLWGGGRFLLPSSDGAPRPAGAFLGIVDRGGGATARLRGVVERADMSDAPLPDAAIRVEAVDGTLVTETGTLTDLAFWEVTLPAREYIVRASHPGFRTGCKYCPTLPGEDVWCSLFLVPGDGEETCVAPDRNLDRGPWPEGDASAPPPDAGPRVDAGPPPPGVSGNCSVTPGASRGLLPALLLLLALALVHRRS